MPKELFWLTLTTAMTGLFWIPYILDRIVVRGLMGAMVNPTPDAKPQHAWAERQKLAHANAVENLVIFAALVLTAHALNISNAVTAGACLVYFWARLVHFIIFTAGLPVLRTLSFAVGFVAQVTLTLAILQAV